MTDRELFERIRSGNDPDAFAGVVQRHLPMAYSAALRILGESHLAEDAAQAAFLVLSQRARTLPGNTILAGWIYAAAQLAARNMRRERARRERREQEVAAMRQAAEVTPSAEPDEVWQMLRSRLDEALAGLPAAQRDAVVLRCLQQRSPAEAARELGCSEDAVSMRLHRGLEGLRNKLRAGRDVSAALLLGLFSMHGSEAVPTGLFETTVGVCSGKAAASAAAVTSAKGVLKIMFWSQIKFYGAACLALLVVCACTGSLYFAKAEDKAPVVEKKNDEQPKTEEPKGTILDGLQVTLISDKKEYTLGDNPALTLVFKNTTDKKLIVLIPTLGKYDYADSATITGPGNASIKGEKLTPREPDDGKPHGGNYQGWDEHYTVLNPGAEYRAALIKDFKPETAGDYSIRITYDTTPSPWGAVSQQLPKQRWKGKVETNALTISVKKAKE